MKSFFFNAATRAKHHAIHAWMIRSTILGSICLLIMATLSLPEYLLHQELASQQRYECALHKAPCTTDSSNARLALSKIEIRQKKAAQPVALLKKIKSLCANESCLESLSIKRHDLQITLAAKNAPALVTIADTLAQQPACDGLHICSLEPKEQRMIAILKSHQETKNS